MKKIKISHKVITTGTHGQDLDNQSSAELYKCHVSHSPAATAPLGYFSFWNCKSWIPLCGSEPFCNATHHTVSTYTPSLEGKNMCFQWWVNSFADIQPRHIPNLKLLVRLKMLVTFLWRSEIKCACINSSVSRRQAHWGMSLCGVSILEKKEIRK